MPRCYVPVCDAPAVWRAPFVGDWAAVCDDHRFPHHPHVRLRPRPCEHCEQQPAVALVDVLDGAPARLCAECAARQRSLDDEDAAAAAALRPLPEDS